MMKKMGFNVMKGIGKNQQGRTTIVQPQFKSNFTTRNSDCQQQQSEESKIVQLKQPQPEVNPYQEFKFQELFQYKSKANNINGILLSIKNSYEYYKNKRDLLKKQIDSFERDKQMTESLKIQKINQQKNIKKQIKALQQFKKSQKSFPKLLKFPQLCFSYKVDLLMIKSLKNDLKQKKLPIISTCLKQKITSLSKNIKRLYQQKQRISINMLNIKTGFEKQFQQNKKNTNFNININFLSISHDQNNYQISTENINKIYKYLQFIICQCVIYNRLDQYLCKVGDISKCQPYIYNIVQFICSFSQKLGKQLKIKYLIPLINNYLQNYHKQSNKTQLPYKIIQPWLFLGIKLKQLNMSSFVINICSKLWTISNYQLYNVIYDWLFNQQFYHKQFFINCYLAPRILYQMESFNFDTCQGNYKDKIKGFLKYCELIPHNQREDIIENTIALTILNKYNKQLEQGGQTKEDLRNWVLRWAEQLNKACDGVLQRIFLENKIMDIW